MKVIFHLYFIYEKSEIFVGVKIIFEDGHKKITIIQSCQLLRFFPTTFKKNKNMTYLIAENLGLRRINFSSQKLW